VTAILQPSDPFSTESKLLTGIIAQQPDALSRLYDQYGTRVYGLALHMVNDPALAEAITEAVFTRIWRDPSLCDPALGRLITRMLVITRGMAIERLRGQQTIRSAFDRETGDETAETPWADLHALVAQLPPEQAEAIEKALFQGMSHTQMAEALHLPLETVKTYVRRGMETLRDLWLASNAKQTDA
jgi:RNA polymerase sigma-70 factor (ECF subfamily)